MREFAKWKAPAEKNGFFEGAAEAGFLVTQTFTRSAVFSGAVNAVAPIKVLFEVVLASLKEVGFYGGGGKQRGEEEEECDCCDCCDEKQNWGSGGFRFWLWGSVECHWYGNWGTAEKRVEDSVQCVAIAIAEFSGGRLETLAIFVSKMVLTVLLLKLK